MTLGLHINDASTTSSKRKPVPRKRTAASNATPSKHATKENAPKKRNAGTTKEAGGSTMPKRRTAGGSQEQKTKASGRPSVSHTRSSASFGFFSRLYRCHLSIALPITLVALLIVFGIGFDIASSWGKIHHGVSVQGIDVGDMTVDEAAAKIEETLKPLVEQSSITVYESDSDRAASDASSDSDAGDGTDTSGGDGEESTGEDTDEVADELGSDTDGDGEVETWTVSAETIGAFVDGSALAQEAYGVGRQGNFIADRLAGWFSGVMLAASISYNSESYAGLVGDINDEVGTEFVDSSISVEDGVASAIDGSDGWLVDEDALTASLSSVFFDEAASSCAIPMQEVSMNIHPETAQKVADEVNTTLQREVFVTYGDQSWTLGATELGDLIGQTVLSGDEELVFGKSTQSVQELGLSEQDAQSETEDITSAPSTQTSAADDVPKTYSKTTGTDDESGYSLQAYIDQEKCDAYLVELLGDMATGGATSASFDTSSGEVVITPSSTGTGPDRATAELQMQNILFGDAVQDTQADQTITLVDTTIEPDLTTEEAESLGIKDKLASWSIDLSGSSNRRSNIKLLCEMINGTLTAPGDTWSFNGTTGERTEEKGFKTAPVIVNGRHEDQLGGGICQVATCVFNAACFSGLGIETRSNHAFYISAYDDRGFADATVSWETPDLEWKNDTENWILLTANTDDGAVTVTLWGTDDGRTVTCDRGEWKEGDQYTTIRESDSSLAAGETEVTQSGINGREIYIHYIATSAEGEVLHDINFHSVYEAQNQIIKVGTG